MKQNGAALTFTFLFAVALFFIRLPSVEHRSVGTNESTTLLAMAGQAVPRYPGEIGKPVDAAKQLFSPLTSYQTIVKELETADGHPPLYYWTLLTWDHVFGSGLVSSRLLSNFLGSVFVFAIGFAFIGVLPFYQLVLFETLVGFSSTLNYFSTEARSYIFCLVLILISFLFALRSVKLVRAGRMQLAGVAFFGTGLLTGLGIFTNYFMALIALAIGFWLLLESRKLKIKTLSLFAFLFALPNVILCLASRHFYNLQHAIHASNRNGYRGFSSDFAMYAKNFVRAFVNRFDDGSWVAVTLLVATVFLVLMVRRKQKSNLEPGYIIFGFLTTFAITLTLFMVNFAMNKFMYPYRYFVLAAPGLFVLTGSALALANTKATKLALNVLVIAVLAIELVNFNWKGRPSSKVDYSKSETVGPIAELLEESRGHRNVLVLVERTLERDWPTGIIANLANPPLKLRALAAEVAPDVLVLPSGVSATEYLASHTELTRYDKVWYMANTDLSEPARQAFEEGRPRNFKTVATFDWGFALEPRRMTSNQ